MEEALTKEGVQMRNTTTAKLQKEKKRKGSLYSDLVRPRDILQLHPPSAHF
jgi:hypothetical protein